MIMLGPDRGAVSGVSAHINGLLASRLGEDFSLVHFQVGSEGRSESRIGRLARLALGPLQLAIAILRNGATIVHVNTSLNARAFWRDIALVLAAKVCGARIVYQVHGGALPQLFAARSRLLTNLLRWTLRVPDVIVVLASVERDAYREFLPGRQIVLLPNGIDCSPYSKLTRGGHDAAAPLRLVYLGRLVREKGLYEVLEGLRLARLEGTRARLLVAGSGSEERGLKQAVQDLGLSETVSFVGPVSGDSKMRLLSNADVFVLASYEEGLPYALLESMAAGVPVLATRVGAIPDVVAEGVHGLLVNCCDPVSIAHALVKLASDRALLGRMSVACRRQIATGYSLDRIGSDFGRLYQELCALKGMRAATRP